MITLFNPNLLLAAAEAEGAAAFDVTAIMTDAVSTVQGQALAVLAIVVPAIVVVVGAVVAVKFGIKWLRSIKG